MMRRNPLCPQCAAPTTGGRFCSQCGAELGTPPAEAAPRPAPAEQPPPDPMMLNGRTVTIARDPWPLGPAPGTTDVVVAGQPQPPVASPTGSTPGQVAGSPARGAPAAPAPDLGGTAPPPPGLTTGLLGARPGPAEESWSGPVTAELGLRLVARLVDGVILLGPLLASVGLALQAVQGGLGTAATLALAVGAGVLLMLVVGYEPVFVAVRGATPGKMTMGLRVVRTRDGQLPGGGQSLLRVLVPWGVGLPTAGLGAAVVYASSLLDRTGDRRGWHDLAAGTRVVAVRPL